LIDAVAVDTDVISFFFKADTRAALYIPHLADKLLIASFMSLAELRQWALVKNWGDRRKSELEAFLKERYIVIQSDDNLCSVWAEVAGIAMKYGKPIDSADAWIAATALLYDVPLVTHNRVHFSGVEGLALISES